MDDVAAVAAPVARDEPEAARRPRRVPRTSSTTIVASTNARERVGDQAGPTSPAPSAISDAAGDDRDGDRAEERLPSERSDARRQAISGPIPISSSSGSPKVRRKKS